MPDIRALFVELVSDPTADNYLRAWTVATELPDYNPYGGELRHIEQLLESGQFQAACDLCYESMGSWLLNPRIHQMAGFASMKLADERTAQMEWHFAAQLIKAIQATGDGTAEHPFLVTCTADEYDVIAAMQKQHHLQALVKHEDKVLDRVECDDGTALHFDITRSYHQLARQMVNDPLLPRPPLE